ncbi:MAG TPA: DMT family transporter [Alphaproteobacteria bacterium]|nr:DMT family transporter [Alphaproteobacteria bacterium]
MAINVAEGMRSGRYALITVVIGISFAFIWSSAFTAAKFALQSSPPMLLLASRFLISGILAMAIAAILGQKLPRRTGQWMRIGILGVCQNTLYLGLMFVAMTGISAGLASIIGSSLPLVMAVLAPLVLRERVGGLKIVGLVVGFAGVVYIMQSRMTGSLGEDPVGILLAFLGVMGLATGTALVKKGDFGTGLLMVVGLQMLVGSLTLMPFALWFDDPGDVSLNPGFLVAFAYIVLFPGIIATLLWFMLLERGSATDAAAYHFLNPVFGVAIAWAVLAEPAGWHDAIGVVLVAAGILVVNRADRRLSQKPS